MIRDVDYAEESANFNKLNIISQTGSYAISQSNAVSQNVLRLYNKFMYKTEDYFQFYTYPFKHSI